MLGECGSLNVISSHNLTGSDTNRTCVFVRMGMALVAEVYDCAGRF